MPGPAAFGYSGPHPTAARGSLLFTVLVFSVVSYSLFTRELLFEVSKTGQRRDRDGSRMKPSPPRKQC